MTAAHKYNYSLYDIPPSTPSWDDTKIDAGDFDYYTEHTEVEVNALTRKKTETIYRNNKIYCVKDYYKNGALRSISYFYVDYIPNYNRKSIWYQKDGRILSTTEAKNDKVITKHYDGKNLSKVEIFTQTKDGCLIHHNKPKTPTEIRFYKHSTQVNKLYFHQRGMNNLNNNTAPCEISYYKSGNIEYERWNELNQIFYYRNGTIKRIVKPIPSKYTETYHMISDFNQDGSLIETKYYIGPHKQDKNLCEWLNDKGISINYITTINDIPDEHKVEYKLKFVGEV